MAIDESIDLLIDRIYEAALSPQTWTDVISAIGNRIGATSGTGLWFGQAGLELLRADIWNVDPDALSAYQQHYLAFCPRFRASRDLEIGAIYDDRQLRAVPNVRTREYYDFMDRFGLGLARIALAEKRPGLTIGINFYNSTDKGLSDDGAEILAHLAPHLRRSCNMTQALSDVVERASFGDAWFKSRTASLTLDANGTVVRMNAAAEMLCALADGLTVTKGRLLAGSTKDRARVEAEVSLALRASGEPSPSSGDFVLISRPSGLPAFALSVIPLTQCYGRERALVTVATTVPAISPASLQRAFGLTPSEAQIAVGLCEGRSPEQIATDRQVSLHTIRSQIKTIYARLEIGSQAELVSRITAASLGVRL